MGFDILSFITGFVAKAQELAIGAGPLGIFLGMALEASIVPFPSEAVLVSAALFGYTPLEVAIWGGLGSTIGAFIGYHIGKLGGRPLLKKYGRYILITPHKLDTMENWFKRVGSVVVLFGRLLPLVPFKIFSLTAGIAKMDLKKFIIFTFLGSVPRAFLLAWLGHKLIEIGSLPLTVISIIAVIVLAIIVDELFIKYLKSKSKKE